MKSRRPKPLSQADEAPIRVDNRLGMVEDPEGAADLFQRILEAVRMARARRRREEKEAQRDDAA